MPLGISQTRPQASSTSSPRTHVRSDSAPKPRLPGGLAAATMPLALLGRSLEQTSRTVPSFPRTVRSAEPRTPARFSAAIGRDVARTRADVQGALAACQHECRHDCPIAPSGVDIGDDPRSRCTSSAVSPRATAGTVFGRSSASHGWATAIREDVRA